MRPGTSSFQMILLAIFGTAAVAGVLIFAFLVGSNTGTSTGAVTIWGTFDEATFQSILRQLVESDDRLRLVSYVQKDEDTFDAELTNALASGTGPDLFILRSDQTIADASKVQMIPYSQLSRDTFRNLWAEAADSFLAPEGVVGLPFAVDPFVLYWNRNMLSSAGIAQPPTYWENLYDLTRAVSKKDDAGSITKSAIALGEYANVNYAKSILSMLMLQAGGRITYRDGSDSLVSGMTTRVGDTGQPGDSALQFYTQFSNPSSPDYSWNRSLPEARVAFSQGDLALYLGPASEEALIRRLNPNLNFSIATTVPQVKNASPDQVVDAGYAYAFAIPKTAKNPSGALTAAYLLAAPESSRLIALGYGFASARRDILTGTAQGNEATFNRMALLVRTWEDPDPKETDRIFKDMIESVTSGAARTIEAIQRADQSFRQIKSN